METFLFWVTVIIVTFSIYAIFISRKSPKGFRLRTNLTITFFLLVLIPAIPLTFGVGLLITRGVEMSLVPEVEQSLENSLQVMKSMMEEKGTHFFDHHRSIGNINRHVLKDHGLLYVRHFKIQDREVKCSNYVNSSNEFSEIQDIKRLLNVYRQQTKSAIMDYSGRSICEVYKFGEDSTFQAVAFDVGENILQAKTQISESLKFYKSLSLFNQSVIEKRIIWALATLFIIILAIIAIYAARVLSRSISEPVQLLALGMQKVASGDLDSRVDFKSKNEFKILIDSFNKMAEDLRLSQKKLVKAERLAAWQDVARRVSHEIRNSLTPIQISLFRLKSQLHMESIENIDAEEMDPLSAIEEEVESLRKISEEFTQFARLPQVKRQKNDINQLIKTIIPLIEGDAKPVRVKNDLAMNIPQFSFDREQLKRALINLLKNSVDASSMNGHIMVTTSLVNNSDTNRSVVIKIEDEGKGMSPELLDKIFEPYFTTKKRGMGLGLSIVKRIIEEHEGRIIIESEEGKGTSVTLALNLE